MPPTLLTNLTLSVPSQHASDTAYHPYTHLVPSQHASDTAYHPYACMPSRHSSDASYHPYAHLVPSQHASDTAYYPYACSALLTCLRCCLPSLCLQCPPDMPPIPPHTGLILKAAYDPYTPAAPSR
ncbi:hypothetical protein O181_129463 [Austropuccinia psidii MF-1]|uniref:Uncharacterized protein n=1 Tax=Austropuccinia psidii MF-1 TaxID=1389203 RepID=A0A9Q3KY73_9BASI|nr:hypothetical protein [Austropuccinia psidii MF-1]